MYGAPSIHPSRLASRFALRLSSRRVFHRKSRALLCLAPTTSAFPVWLNTQQPVDVAGLSQEGTRIPRVDLQPQVNYNLPAVIHRRMPTAQTPGLLEPSQAAARSALRSYRDHQAEDRACATCCVGRVVCREGRSPRLLIACPSSRIPFPPRNCCCRHETPSSPNLPEATGFQQPRTPATWG